MKTFSKILSLILVGVMCFGLFATSAFAFDFGDSGNSGAASGFNADAGSGFDFSGSNSNTYDDFSLNASSATQSAPAFSNDNFSLNVDSSTTQSAAASSDDGFTLNGTGTNENTTQATFEETSEDGFIFGDSGSMSMSDTAMFGTPYSTDMTFSVSPSATSKKNPVDIIISITSPAGAKFETDTFAEVRYSTDPSGDSYSVLVPGDDYEYATDGTLKIFKSWVTKSNVKVGQYYFFGKRPSDPMVKLGNGITVSKGEYNPNATVANSPYDKYKAAQWITVTVTSVEIPNMKGGFGVATSNNSYHKVLDAGVDYTVNGNVLSFTKTYLNNLDNGTYYIVGFPFKNDYTTQVDMGNMVITSGTDSGSDWGFWTLSPNYYNSWTSGDDILWFWSNLMAKRNEYPKRVVVVRYGVGANSIPNRQVDVNQYWDIQTDPGTFGLGTNFLSSLSAGTYTLQVVDLKTLDCTNTVTFKIGSTLRAIDTDKHVIGSIKNLRFLCDEPVEEVYVGNIPLTYGEDYALSNGNKTVTLSFEFLNRRSAGYDYTIKVRTYSGDYPSATFHILSAAQGSASPRTGDESNLGLWAAFLLLSGTAIVVLVPKLRKYNF